MADKNWQDHPDFGDESFLAFCYNPMTKIQSKKPGPEAEIR
jgi:hypothetical protein